MNEGNKEKRRMGRGGLLVDGVDVHPTTEQDLQGYELAKQALAGMRSPVLLNAQNKNSRLFIANFDGTGNDVINDPEHATNVAKIHAGIEAASAATNGVVAGGYVAGPGRQDGWWDVGRTK
jgi:hypothetical protein